MRPLIVVAYDSARPFGEEMIVRPPVCGMLTGRLLIVVAYDSLLGQEMTVRPLVCAMKISGPCLMTACDPVNHFCPM